MMHVRVRVFGSALGAALGAEVPPVEDAPAAPAAAPAPALGGNATVGVHGMLHDSVLEGAVVGSQNCDDTTWFFEL
jgi:hypothetical protein